MPMASIMTVRMINMTAGRMGYRAPVARLQRTRAGHEGGCICGGLSHLG